MIDWESDESHVLLNPRLPEPERARLRSEVPAWKRMIYVATSGSTGPMRLVALTKDAVLASAAAVNDRLGANKDDVWCRVLPSFHVGGLGIEARAHLSCSAMVEMTWNVEDFLRSKATLASLVPAQVYDLVRASARAPASFRRVIVGGGAFDRALEDEARALGWPVVTSYAMSECASTISLDGVLLGHLEARRESDGRIALRGSSLLEAYVLPGGQVFDPKVDGWFISDDFGEVDGRKIRIHGRSVDFIKIGGESVDLSHLDRILNRVRIGGDPDAAIVAVSDDRLGCVIHLAATGEAGRLADAFNAEVAPFERVRETHLVPSIPRSSLGKLLRGELLDILE